MIPSSAPGGARQLRALKLAALLLTMSVAMLFWLALSAASSAEPECLADGSCLEETLGDGDARGGGAGESPLVEARAEEPAHPFAPADSAFVASRRGSVYYPRACDAWSGLARENLIWFADERAAAEAGFRRTTSGRCSWDGAGEASAGVQRARDHAPSATRSRTAEPGAVAGICTVRRIVDGDTLVCAEGGERIRLLLVDAPELSQGEPGRLAATVLAELLPVGVRARVERDVRERDRYGRLLAYLYDAEGRMVNEELARRGVVTVSVYPPNVRHVERIRAAVAEARAARRGLWAGSAFECSPADFRAGRCR